MRKGVGNFIAYYKTIILEKKEPFHIKPPSLTIGIVKTYFPSPLGGCVVIGKTGKNVMLNLFQHLM